MGITSDPILHHAPCPQSSQGEIESTTPLTIASLSTELSTFAGIPQLTQKIINDPLLIPPLLPTSLQSIGAED